MKTQKEQSIELIKFWLALDEIKKKLDDLTIMAVNLEVDHPKLMISLGTIAFAIDNHFKKFRLQVIVASENDQK